MESFIVRHQKWLIGLVTLAGLALLLWIDARRGEVEQGRQLPGEPMAQLGGEPVALAALKGQPLVLDFWASWCGPCRESLPELDALARRTPGVRFFAVNVDDEPDEVQDELRARLSLQLPMLTRGEVLSRSLGVQMLPTTVLVGRDGRVAASFVGVTSPSRLAAALAALP